MTLAFLFLFPFPFLQMAMTEAGIVFSWGFGGDGALGHGDTQSIAQPKMVQWFLEQQRPIKAVDIDVGSDIAGGHSCLVSSTGIA